jgi:translation elongation factor EF-Tu-like GTPase
MTVEHRVEIKDRGTVAAGTLLSGFPKSGETNVIEVDGRLPKEAFLSGVEMGSRPPKVGILLRGIAMADVPIGAYIRSVGK